MSDRRITMTDAIPATMTLPRQRTVEKEPTSGSLDDRTFRRRILVVDHEVDARNVLCDRLAYLGFDVVAEDNGFSGLARIFRDWESSPFHGMLVELQMPILGGLAVLQEMRDRFPSVPVMVMSDSHHIGKLRQALRLGAKEYLVKPFDMELFRRKCESVFLEGRQV
ncbi:MAG TPA: response regulator [Nitrospira sp.]|nr:response regulator [Nitrospira sp.]